MKKVLAFVVALVLMFTTVGCDSKVATVTFEKTAITLRVGGTETLIPTITNSTEKATFTSDKAEVATVDLSGKVTAVGVGTAKIKAKVGSAEAVCTVTVKAAIEILLNATATNMEIGDTETITATVTGSTAQQVWTSSNTAVATVSSVGLITAVAAGTATVTVTVEDKAATVAVRVFAEPSLTFDSDTEVVVMGEPLTLDPTVSREDYIVLWDSSNKTVATVSDSGVVTPIAVGTTTITASFTEAPEVKDTCVITVKMPDAITLNANRITLKAVGDTFQLSGTINNGITDPLEWESSDPTILSVSDSGLITALKVGTAKITASAVGTTAICTATVQDFTGYTQIFTVKQFMVMANGMTETDKYVLMNDLDFTGHPIVHGFGFNNGAHFEFNATFDGNGYAIKNLLLGYPDSTADTGYNNAVFCSIGWKGVVRNVTFEKTKAGLGGNSGIISDLNYGLIENINFIDCTVKNLATWNSRTGGVVGKNMTNGIIRNISGKIMATGTVTGVKDSWGGGAIAGGNDSKIENCIIDTNVQSETEKRYEYLVYKKTDAELIPDNVLRKTAEEQKNVELYKGWDLGLWKIDGTAAPTLKNAGVEAPLIVEIDAAASLYTGYSVKLVADVNKPGKTVVWTTSDDTVATVAGGVVTSVGVGECDITATVDTVSAVCKVSVAKAPIKLNQQVINIAIEATETLTYELADPNAEVVWATSDSNVALVSKTGVVTGVGFGSATITATVADLTVECAVNCGQEVLKQDFTTLATLPEEWIKTVTGAASKVELRDNALKFDSNAAGANAALLFPTDAAIGANTRYSVELNFEFNAYQDTGRYIAIRFAQTGADAFAQFAIRVNAKTHNSGIEMAQWNKTAFQNPNPPKDYSATSNYCTFFSKDAAADLKKDTNINIRFVIDGQDFTLFLDGKKIGGFKRDWAQDQTSPAPGTTSIFNTYTTKNIQIFADKSDISVKNILVMVDPASAPAPAPDPAP